MNVKNNSGTIDTIRYNEPIPIDELYTYIRQRAEENGVSVSIRKDIIHSGGLITGRDYPCLVFTHPNPPKEYFQQVWVANDCFLNRYFWGNSWANRKVNTYNYKKNSSSLLDNISAGLFGSADNELQIEQAWHASVISLLETD